MARRIPPLNPLRTFEAAARFGTFAKAAEELHVTPAAVSRQVKLLENYFGVEFFDRNSSGVKLNSEAKSYAASLTRAFKQIEAATAEFRTNQTSSILTIRGYTTFFQKWLIPRLPEFYGRQPQIRVRLISGSMATETARIEADIFVRYGAPPWYGMTALPLFVDELVPFCSPRLAKSAMTPSEIAKLQLLSLYARRMDWPDWFAAAGHRADKLRVQSFEDLSIVFEYVRQGLGVAVTQRAYLKDDLEQGQVVLLSDIVLRRRLGYYALIKDDSVSKQKVAVFLEWLRELQTDEARGLGA